MPNLQQHTTSKGSENYQDENYQSQDQEMLLGKTRQKKINNKSNSSQSEHDQKDIIIQNQINDKYVKNQHSKIKEDFTDFNDLQQQIERLKKIKNEYKEQKQSIQQLSKVVQTLKSQNRSLKLQKQSNRDQSVRKDMVNQIQRNINSHQKNSRRLSNPNRDQNKIKGNIVNKDLNKKIYNLQNVGMQRFLSPQAHRRISSNSLRNIGHIDLKQGYLNDMYRMDQETVIKNHQHNKKSVIASFVEELKQQLQQNQLVLQRQKRAHRQTKQKLQTCLDELAEIRLLLDRQRNYDVMERQNIQLKKQLEFETEQRLLAQERLREKQVILSQYDAGFSTGCSQFDRELDKMDQIYFSIEKTLKL